MPRKRLTYLDMAKGVGIFLVVLGHIEYIQEDTLKWISSFHMPLFFVIGGILSYAKRNEKKPFFYSACGKSQGNPASVRRFYYYASGCEYLWALF